MTINFEKFENLGKEAGLSQNEVKVYLANLDLGPSPVQKIAQKASLSRMACYTILESLLSKGLVSHFIKGKKRYWAASNPDRLLELSREKERKLDQEKDQIRQFLPELKSIYNLAGKKPEVRFYEGVEGLKAIYEDTLSSREDFLVYSSLADVDRLIPDQKFWSRYIKKRVSLGIRAKGICPRSKEALKLTKTDKQELREIRFLPEGEDLGPTETYIYDDKVAMLSFSGEIVGVVIENKEFAETQRKIFERIWRTLK